MFFKELRFFGGLRSRTPAGGYAPPTPSSEGVPSAGLAVLHMQTCGAWKENKVLALRRSLLRALPRGSRRGQNPRVSPYSPYTEGFKMPIYFKLR